MRHNDIKTTMSYYVDLDVDEVADGLWADHEPSGNSGNTCDNIAPKEAEIKGRENCRKSL